MTPSAPNERVALGTHDAFLPTMNAHFFGAKRAFHATLRLGRAVLAKFGLTPARFDLLFALRRGRYGSCFPTLQRDLRTILGVSAATICRMVQSLEALGLLVRSRPAGDTRQRYLELTPEGRARVERVRESVIDSDRIVLAVDSALAGDRWHDDWHCLRESEAAESMFRRIRTVFGDRATLYYPWHPDD